MDEPKLADTGSRSEVVWRYPWIVAREVDRINRQSQRYTSLSARIAKLKGLSEPLLWKKDQELSRRVGRRIERLLRMEGYAAHVTRFAPVYILDDQAIGWADAWQQISQAEHYNPQSLHDVRWRQFAHLMRLFTAHEIFDENPVPTAHISAFKQLGIQEDHPP